MHMGRPCKGMTFSDKLDQFSSFDNSKQARIEGVVRQGRRQVIFQSGSEGYILDFPVGVGDQIIPL